MKYIILKIVSCFFLLLLMANLATALVWAHANYVRSDPPANINLPSGQPPGRIQVWFSENLEPKFSELQVLNNNRQRIDNNDSRVPNDTPQSMIVSLKPNLPDGPYTVIYKTTSAEDGHVIKNNFAFVVGVGAIPPPATNADNTITDAVDDNFNFWSVAIRWLNYLGSAALIGGIAWQLFIWQPALRKVKDRIGSEQTEAGQEATQRGNQLLQIAGGLLGLGWLAFLLYQATRFGGQSPIGLFTSSALLDFLFSTRFGLIWLARLGLIVVLGLFLSYVNKRLVLPVPKFSRLNLVPEAEPPLPTSMPVSQVTTTNGNRAYWILLLLGGLILLTTSLTSHAAASNLAWLLIPLDWLHLLSTGLWVGGLFYLALAMPPALAKLRPGTGDRTRILAALISNFSYVGIITVTLLLISGAIQAAVHLGAVSDLFDTGYGLALSVKLVAIALMLGLAAYHLLKVSPQMNNFARRKGETNGAGSMAAGLLQIRFRRTVIIEAILGVILLGIVGGLTSFGPPAGNAASGLNLRGQIADLNYVLRVDPAQIGSNNFDLTLTQRDGQVLSKANAVVLRLNMTDMEMGTQELNLNPIPNSPGHYQANGQILSMSGNWRAELIVRRDSKEDAISQVGFKVR